MHFSFVDGIALAVNAMIGVFTPICRISAAASNPLLTGIAQSIRIKSILGWLSYDDDDASADDIRFLLELTGLNLVLLKGANADRSGEALPPSEGEREAVRQEPRDADETDDGDVPLKLNDDVSEDEPKDCRMSADIRLVNDNEGDIKGVVDCIIEDRDPTSDWSNVWLLLMLFTGSVIRLSTILEGRRKSIGSRC